MMSLAEMTAALPAFVGREHELAQLMGYLEQADRGHGRVVLVRGEAGVGKSTLISVVQKAAAGQFGAFCARGQCLDQDAPVPYLPFTDALRAYFGLASGDSSDVISRKIKHVLVENAPGLVSLVPVIGGVLAAGIGISLSVQKEFGFGRTSASEERDKLFFSLYQLIKRISQKQPLVLFLDDLHWADKASLDLLHFLAREVKHDRILLIGAYRPDGLRDAAGKETHLAHMRRRLNREELLFEIWLSSFGEAETRELVAAHLPNAAFPDDFYAWLYQRGQGNPYCAEQFLRTLKEQGLIVKAEDCWTLAGPIDALAMPENLHDLFHGRLQALDYPARDLLQVASAIGDQFTYSLLFGAAGRSEDELCERLEHALHMDVLLEQQLDGEDGFRFAHSLWRETLYGEIPAFKCHRAHRRIAECLERQHAGRTETAASQLAHHYLRAGNHEQAVKYLQIAAQGAQKVLALDDALQYYDTAIALLPDGAGPAALELLLARGEVHYMLSNSAQAKQDFQAALPVATEAHDARAIAISQLRIGQVMGYWESDWDGATPLFCEAIPLFEQAGDVDNLVDAYCWLGDCYEFGGDWTEGEIYYNKALEAARQGGVPAGEAVALSFLGYLDYIRANWPAAIAKLTQAAAMMEALQLAPALAYAYRWLALTYEDMGDYETALGCLHREVAIRQKLGQRKMPGTDLALGSCYRKQHQLDLAGKHLKKALDDSEKASQLKADAESFYGQYWLARGDLDQALEYALASIETYKAAKYPEMLASGLMYLGNVYDARGEVQKAIDVSREGLEIAQRLDARKIAADIYCNLGRYYERQGQAEPARASYEQAAAMYRRLDAQRFLGEVEAALERLAAGQGAAQ